MFGLFEKRKRIGVSTEKELKDSLKAIEISYHVFLDYEFDTDHWEILKEAYREKKDLLQKRNAELNRLQNRLQRFF